VITHPAFTVEPWSVRETYLDLDMLAACESVFALSNGHIGLRGNLDEGEPFGLPGTYLNSFYELRPLPYAEAGYGNPESGQTIVNVTTGRSPGCSSTTSHSTSGTAGCLRTSASSISVRACCAAAPSGGRRRARPSVSGRRGWSRSCSARRRRFCTRSSRSTDRSVL
jgi:hypothetical protein